MLLIVRVSEKVFYFSLIIAKGISSQEESRFNEDYTTFKRERTLKQSVLFEESFGMARESRGNNTTAL